MSFKILFLAYGLAFSSAALMASDNEDNSLYLTEPSLSPKASVSSEVNFNEYLIQRLAIVSVAAGWGLPEKNCGLESVIDHMIGDAQKMQAKNLLLAHELGRLQGLMSLPNDKADRSYSPFSSLRRTTDSFLNTPAASFAVASPRARHAVSSPSRIICFEQDEIEIEKVPIPVATKSDTAKVDE
jgi:hypothetical protein